MISVKQILSPPSQGAQFWLTISGILVGIIASVLAIVLMVDIQLGTADNEDVFGDNTLVVQKQVSRLSTLGLNETHFTDEEVQILKGKDFILEVAPFKSANYEVGISENPGDGLPGFYAEMFLQSVPNSFLTEVDSISWQWNSEADIVPIILPRDFLTLVNYGIAPSKGMPQISEELIKSVRLRLHLIAKNGKGIVLGRVVGFSSKIASVLVPNSFIDYSNKKYGFKSEKPASRLFLKTKPKSFGEINKLIGEMNLDISASELSIAKLSTYFLQMILLFFVFSIIILLLAVMALLQYLQIVLMQFKYEVNLLIKIGYNPKAVMTAVQNQFLAVLAVASFVALVAVFLIKLVWIQPFLVAAGFNAGYLGYIFGILFVIVLVMVCIFVLRKAIMNTILKIYKKQ